MTSPEGTPEFLTSKDGARLAYHRLNGRSPGVVFCGGFRSDMTGTKATALEQTCARLGHAFVRFDYFGHGQSDGEFTDGTISRWREDAIHVLDNLTTGPQVIIGSSMGGWIMLLAALARPDRVHALLGLAAAPDFTQDLMWEKFPEGVKDHLRKDGVYLEPSDYDEELTPITMRLIEDGREHLLLRDPIPLTCPVRLIHGMLDPDVPWQTGPEIIERLESEDATVALIKNGDHRLSEPGDISRMNATLEKLLATSI